MGGEGNREFEEALFGRRPGALFCVLLDWPMLKGFEVDFGGMRFLFSCYVVFTRSCGEVDLANI